MTIEDVFNEVLPEIIPTKEELQFISDIVKKVSKLLEDRAKDQDIKYTSIEPQGSTGIKQTQLRDDFDVDLFIGLNYDSFDIDYRQYSKNELKKILKEEFQVLCNKWIIPAIDTPDFQNPDLLYAEHPYVSVDYIGLEKDRKIKLDLVLYFDLPLEFIKNKGPITSVDRSPWHGRFVKSNLSPEQKNDVRLLKQFFKACHSYGDKSALGRMGFIGYSAELLLYHFHNLRSVFEQFSELPDNPLDYFGREAKTLEKIRRFQNDYLIIIDPVDKRRNVASAISEKSFHYCNYQIKEFLQNPHKSYFEIDEIPLYGESEAELKYKNNMFILECKSNDEDTHYTIFRDKLYSLGSSIETQAEKESSHQERFGRILYEVYFEDSRNEYNLAVYCEKPEISETYPRRGPKVSNQKHAQKFKNKNTDIFKKNGFLWVNEHRDFTKFIDFLRDFIVDKIPDNLKLINASTAVNAQTSSGKKCLYVLENMVLPFFII